MKIFTFIAAIFLTLPLFGQQDSLKNDTIKNIKVEYKDSIGTFKWDIGGLTDFVYLGFDTFKTNEVLYNGAVDWISKTAQSHNRAILVLDEKKIIRFEGISKKALSITSSRVETYDLKYVIDITFENKKIKINPVSLFRSLSASNSNLSEDWKNFPLESGSEFYKYQKESNSYEIKKFYKNYPMEISGLFNAISENLFYHILSNDEIIEVAFLPPLQNKVLLTNYNYSEKDIIDWTAGDHFLEAKRLKKQSLIILPITAGIGGLIIAGTSGQQEYIVLGSAIFGIGTIISYVMNLQSANHIGKAGEKLNNITFNNQGIGFKYSF